MTNVKVNNEVITVSANSEQDTNLDVKMLKNTIHHLAINTNAIVHKAIENNIKEVVSYSNELNTVLIDSLNSQVTKDTVIKCQNTLANLISSLVYGYLPTSWKNIQLWTDQKAMIELLCTHKKLIVALDPNVCDGYISLTCNFREWSFVLKKELFDDLLTLKDKKQENTPNVYIPNLEDWYFCYGGRKQIYDCVTEKNCDLFISEQGTIHRNVVDGFVADTLRGWDFNAETLNHLINILDNDGYDVDFDDTQTAIHIKEIKPSLECEVDDYE